MLTICHIILWNTLSNSSARYVKEDVSNVHKYLTGLDDESWQLPKRAENPFVMNYEPDLDEAQVLTLVWIHGISC